MPADIVKIFEDYYDSLTEKLESKRLVAETNHDRIHNSAIMKLMLDHGGQIDMFCGSMSVFRDDFYNDIKRDNPEGSEAEIKSMLANSLTSFLAKDGSRLRVVQEHSMERLPDDLIVSKSVFESAMREGKLEIYSLESNFLWKDMMSHFAISSVAGMMRMETDKTTHEGMFIANAEATSKLANTTFDKLLEKSELFQA